MNGGKGPHPVILRSLRRKNLKSWGTRNAPGAENFRPFPPFRVTIVVFKVAISAPTPFVVRLSNRINERPSHRLALSLPSLPCVTESLTLAPCAPTSPCPKLVTGHQTAIAGAPAPSTAAPANGSECLTMSQEKKNPSRSYACPKVVSACRKLEEMAH